MTGTLAGLRPGDTGRILRIVDEELRDRLEALGLTPGTSVQMLQTAPAGDPMVLRARGVSLALRRRDGARFFLSDKPPADAGHPGIKPVSAPALAGLPGSSQPCPRRCVGCTRASAKVRRKPGQPVLALAGSPNCGKTTLFNALTGAKQAVGNYPGVTVELSRGWVRLEQEPVVLLDLPGLYALTSVTAEEAAARAVLLGGGVDGLICVADACHLERSLFLVLQCRDLGLPMAVALTFSDTLRRAGGKLDHQKLSRLLGVPALPVDAPRGEGLDALRQAMAEQLRRGPSPSVPAANAPDAGSRYREIEALVSACLTQKEDGPSHITRRIDRLALGRVTAVPLLLALLLGVFWITFGPVGQGLGALLTGVLGALTPLLTQGLALLRTPDWLQGALLEGVWAGVGGVLGFLPQTALLFACLSLLEDSGYLARAAVVLDSTMGLLGLGGKAVIPLLLGFGCTVTAALSVRTLAEPADRHQTLALLPFVSCSARLPVYALVSGLVLPSGGWFAIPGLYALGLGVGAITGLLHKTRQPAPFLLELPPYRLPTVRNLIVQVWERVQAFLLRAGTLIVLLSLLLWLLEHVTPGLQLTASRAESLLGALGRFLAPALEPLGFGSWQAAVSLLTGLAAKEAVAASVLQLGVLETLRPAGALSFMTFVLLYTPCAAALGAIWRELGSGRRLLVLMVRQLALAWLVSFGVYHGMLLLC